jgi:hypothetical protein
MQSGLRGPDGNTERGGNLRQWQVEVVVKDDDQTLVGVESLKPPVNLIAVIQGARRLGRVMQVQLHQLDLDWSATVLSKLVVTGSHEEPVEPGIETVGVAQAG